MRIRFLVSVFAVALLVISCFLPWITIETKNITITGVNTKPTSFGMPALFHFVWAGLYLLMLLLNKIWSMRTAVGIAGFNIAWALRNFWIIPACAGGECPVKLVGLYLLLTASALMFFALFIERKAQ